MLLQMRRYFSENMDSFLISLREHVVISVLAVTAAALIGVGLGYVCVRNKKYERWIVAFFQVLRIVPSLAVLILLIPVMGTGFRPALTALILLAIPPVLMNTVTGFEEVPEFMLETAVSLGMTKKQILWKVEAPLALPMILTGIKTGMVEVVASATIAAKIGAGGLGGIILTGLGLSRMDLLFIGGISVAVLSILAGALLDLVDRLFMGYNFIKN